MLVMVFGNTHKTKIIIYLMLMAISAPPAGAICGSINRRIFFFSFVMYANEPTYPVATRNNHCTINVLDALIQMR